MKSAFSTFSNLCLITYVIPLYLTYPTQPNQLLKEKLAANANIVLDKYFESAIIRIQQGKADSLMPSEEQSVRHLKKLPKQNHESSKSNWEISFADQPFKKQRLDKQGSPSEYLDLWFLIPTLNICEQLFSQAGFCFNNQSMSVLPIHAEAQMFLHLNMDLWNIDTVKDILAKIPQ